MDLWDSEFTRKDKLRGLVLSVSFIFSAIAQWLGLGWWSLLVFFGPILGGVIINKMIERKYDRIRIETDLRFDDKTYGLGWDTKEQVRVHIRTLPRYCREVLQPFCYYTDDGRERWAISNKPAYWRDSDAENKIRDKYPPTPEEVAMMDDMRSTLLEKARSK